MWGEEVAGELNSGAKVLQCRSPELTLQPGGCPGFPMEGVLCCWVREQRGDGVPAGVPQVLLQKMKGGGFPWSRLLLIGLVFAVGFLLHDVQTHGSLQGRARAAPSRGGLFGALQAASRGLQPRRRAAQGLLPPLAASTSARVLRSSGILSASQQAWHKASHYALQGYRSVPLGQAAARAPEGVRSC